MPQLHILAIGKLKGALAEAVQDYAARMVWPLTLREFDFRESNPALQQEKESAALLKAVPTGARIVILDERGKLLDSAAFAKQLGDWDTYDSRPTAFLLGGADGHTAALRARADFLLSLVKMTWPHKLARLMLVEQLYRAQQILAGHPYHRA